MNEREKRKTTIKMAEELEPGDVIVFKRTNADVDEIVRITPEHVVVRLVYHNTRGDRAEGKFLRGHALKILAE